ncbi:MAG: hypothetical protein ACKO7W_13060, partial [Elainella sp.]
FLPHHNKRGKAMTTEFNGLLPDSPAEKAQIWIIGTKEQVQHTINECYVRRLATDRSQFTPVFPFPFSSGKYMSILVR